MGVEKLYNNVGIGCVFMLKNLNVCWFLVIFNIFDIFVVLFFSGKFWLFVGLINVILSGICKLSFLIWFVVVGVCWFMCKW